MMSKIKNEKGTIIMENEVVARIAGFAAMSCVGVVGMAAKSLRDGLVGLLKIESLSKGVRVGNLDCGGLAIDLRVIVEYGTNIPAIAKTLQENVAYAVQTRTGLTVRRVNVFVDGVRTN